MIQMKLTVAELTKDKSRENKSTERWRQKQGMEFYKNEINRVKYQKVRIQVCRLWKGWIMI